MREEAHETVLVMVDLVVEEIRGWRFYSYWAYSDVLTVEEKTTIVWRP